MKKEGYFPAQMQIHEPQLLEHLREAIEALTRELKAPPSFIFLSDEAWDLAHEALPWLGAYIAKEEEEFKIVSFFKAFMPCNAVRYTVCPCM